MTTRVGEYARISDDDERDPLHGKGINRQQTDTGTVLRLRGWESGGQYVDDDLSAYKIDVVREGFERMMFDLETGKLDGIVGYDVDRIFRQPSDLERALRIYDSRPGLVFATVQGGIDLSTSDGRTMARVLVAFANKSSMDTSRRVSRQKLERAMSGDNTSNYRAFGWNDDGSFNGPEATLLREAIRQVFVGVGLPSITMVWNQRGIKTVRGKEWHSFTLRRVLSAPRLAGFSVYKGEILIDDGQPVKGNWTPLLEEPEWRALHDLVNPRKGAPPVRRKSYLLSGIARCGLCGMGMVGGSKPNRPNSYSCRSKDSGGCNKISINGDKLDKQITALVLAYTKDHQVVETELPDFQGETRLVEIAGKIAELMREYREGGMSAGLIFPEIRKLETEQRQLEVEQSRYTRQKKRATTISGEWPDLELAEQRAVILSVLEAVVVAPTGRGGGYRPDRVTPVWLQ